MSGAEGELEPVIRKLDRALQGALASHPGLPVFLWSLEGRIPARGPGTGWSVQVHLEEDPMPGGVRHLVLGFGPVLSHALADALIAWIGEAHRRHPGTQPPRVEVDLDC